MAKPWEKAAAPQGAPRPMKPWEKAAAGSAPPIEGTFTVQPPAAQANVTPMGGVGEFDPKAFAGLDVVQSKPLHDGNDAINAGIEEAAALVPGGYANFQKQPPDPARMQAMGYVQDPLAKGGYAKTAQPDAFATIQNNPSANNWATDAARMMEAPVRGLTGGGLEGWARTTSEDPLLGANEAVDFISPIDDAGRAYQGLKQAGAGAIDGDWQRAGEGLKQASIDGSFTAMQVLPGSMTLKGITAPGRAATATAQTLADAERAAVAASRAGPVPKPSKPPPAAIAAMPDAPIPVAPQPPVPAVAPFSQPPAPKGGVIGRNADRLVGGAVGGFLGGGGDAFAAPGDGNGDGGNPLFGAGTGAAIGFFGPRAAASVGGRAWRSAARPFRGAGFDERVAARAVRNSMRSGGIASADEAAAAATARFGDKPATMADLSQQATGLTSGLARLPGETGEATRARGEQLLQNRPGRVFADIEGTTNIDPASVTQTIDDSIRAASEEISPAYEEMFTANKGVNSERLMELMADPIIAPHLRGAMRASESLGTTAGQAQSNLRTWDLVKRSLDRTIEGQIRSGGQAAPELMAARQAVRDELDALVPEYKGIRDNADAPRMRDARKKGAQIMGGGLSVEKARKIAESITGRPLTTLQASMIEKIVPGIEKGRNVQALASGNTEQLLAAAFGPDVARDLVARIRADVAIVENARRMNPNVGSPTSQVMMGGGEGPLAVAANLFRAGTNPLQTALAAMSKSGAYTQAQRDLMGQMLVDGATPENLARIYRGRTPRPPRPAPAAPTAPPAPRRPLPGETSSSPAFVGGAAIGALGGAAANPDDPGKGAVLGAIGGGVVGYGAGKLAGGPKALPAPKPPKPPVPKAPVAKGADYKLSNLSPGDRIATINKRHQPAGPNLPLPYWDAATAIKRNGGDRAAATAELQTYADYLRKTKSDPAMIENVDRTIKAVDAVDPVDFDDAAFNASMKGRIEAGGTAAMEQGAKPAATSAPSSVTPLKPAPKPPTRQGMGINASGAGAAGGGILGYTLNPADANGDGVIDDLDRGLNGFGGMLSGGIAGKALGSRAAGKFGNRMKGPPRSRVDAQTFGGVNAKTADRAALGRAQNMEAEGADRNAIWDATGWFKGVDGKWRFEIDDSGAKIGSEASLVFGGSRAYPGSMKDVLDHPELYKAYPNMANDPAMIKRTPQESGLYEGSTRNAGAFGPDLESVRSTMLHEAGGHGVQDIENFARGGAPENAAFVREKPLLDAVRAEKKKVLGGRDPYAIQNRIASGYKVSEADLAALSKWEALIQQEDEILAGTLSPYEAYKRLAGETEARNVQTRRDFTPEERRARRPWETQDVPDDQQIVRFGSGKAESRPKPPPNRLASGPPKRESGVIGNLAQRAAVGAATGAAVNLATSAGAQDDLPGEIRNAEGKISSVEQEIATLKKAKADFDKITDPFEKQRFLKAAGLYPGDIDGDIKGRTTDGINAWDAKNAQAIKDAEASRTAGKAELDGLKKQYAYQQMQREQNPFFDAVRELGPSGAAVLGGVAATVLRIRGVGKSAKAVKVIENDINDLLTNGPVKQLMAKGGAANKPRNRAVNMNQFYREGGAPDNKLPFNYGPQGWKPNPKAAKPGSLYSRETTTKMDGVGSSFIRPNDVKIIGAGLLDSALVTPFVSDAEEELKKAEADVEGGNESVEALRRVEKAKTNLAMYQAIQRLGWGIAGAGALGIGYRYKLPKPDIRGAEDEVTAISDYLKSKAPPRQPRQPSIPKPPPAPPPSTLAAPTAQLLLPLPPPKPKKPKKP